MGVICPFNIPSFLCFTCCLCTMNEQGWVFIFFVFFPEICEILDLSDLLMDSFMPCFTITQIVIVMVLFVFAV